MTKLRNAFAASLRLIRNSKGLTQEDFSDVSSRTYLSSLERGEKCPTLEKVDQIANQMNVHPLSLLVLTYSKLEKHKDLGALFSQIERDIGSLE